MSTSPRVGGKEGAERERERVARRVRECLHYSFAVPDSVHCRVRRGVSNDDWLWHLRVHQFCASALATHRRWAHSTKYRPFDLNRVSTNINLIDPSKSWEILIRPIKQQIACYSQIGKLLSKLVQWAIAAHVIALREHFNIRIFANCANFNEPNWGGGRHTFKFKLAPSYSSRRGTKENKIECIDSCQMISLVQFAVLLGALSPFHWARQFAFSPFLSRREWECLYRELLDLHEYNQ